MKGERPKFHRDRGGSDYICSVCDEPWEAYEVREALKGRESAMTKQQAETFMEGNGCPCCLKVEVKSI